MIKTGCPLAAPTASNMEWTLMMANYPFWGNMFGIGLEGPIGSAVNSTSHGFYCDDRSLLNGRREAASEIATSNSPRNSYNNVFIWLLMVLITHIAHCAKERPTLVLSRQWEAISYIAVSQHGTSSWERYMSEFVSLFRCQREIIHLSIH